MSTIQINNKRRSAMKTCEAAFLSIAAFLVAVGPILAQDYEIHSLTIANGGCIISGGPYVFSDTIGPQVTAPMSGGAYTFQGGVWSMVTILQTPGGPALSLRRAAENQLVISWPSSAGGFVLQQAAGLNPPVVWTDVTAPVVVTADNNTVTQPASASQRYYRLQRVVP